MASRRYGRGIVGTTARGRNDVGRLRGRVAATWADGITINQSGVYMLLFSSRPKLKHVCVQVVLCRWFSKNSFRDQLCRVMPLIPLKIRFLAGDVRAAQELMHGRGGHCMFPSQRGGAALAPGEGDAMRQSREAAVQVLSAPKHRWATHFWQKW